MADISAQLVRELRDKTGAGFMDCKQALAASGGDFEKAVDELRKKGLKTAEKRAGKVAAEGVVFSYIHAGGRIGVMLELNCETDFVARSPEFQELASRIAMHIAWSSPKYVQREEIPQEVLARESEILKAQLKPEQQKMADKIIVGKLEKFYEEQCLVEQFDIRDPAAKKRVKDLLNDLTAKIGEKIAVRRFARYEVGQGIEKPVSDFAQEVAAAAGQLS